MGRRSDLDWLRAKVVDRGLTSAAMARQPATPSLPRLLFLPGFTTKERRSRRSPAGVRPSAWFRSMVHAVRGSGHIASQPGKGTRFILQLPISISVIRALLVEIAGEPYAFPLEPD